MQVRRGDAVALTRALVEIDSRNPSLDSAGPGEGAVARALARILVEWGFRVELVEVAPDRPNVVARVGPPGGPTLMFNGHLDVVGIEGMIHDPFDAEIRGGRIYGRGSSDMKGGVAAMCAAAARAEADLEGEVIIAAVIDEEYESLGTRALVASGIRADAAIVTEPTRLAIMPAHRGFVWTEVVTHGRAAHGSRWDIGIDAIRHAGVLLAELDQIDGEVLPKKTHPLLGRPSLHASTVEGGLGISTYPDRCTLKIERRTIPGESTTSVLDELHGAIERARRRQPHLHAEARILFSQNPSDVPADAPVVRQLDAALRAENLPPTVEGMSAWTDAALLNDAGIPAICFGPGDITLAHAAEEYIAVEEIERATAVLTTMARQWCSSTQQKG